MTCHAFAPRASTFTALDGHTGRILYIIRAGATRFRPIRQTRLLLPAWLLDTPTEIASDDAILPPFLLSIWLKSPMLRLHDDFDDSPSAIPFRFAAEATAHFQRYITSRSPYHQLVI